MKLSEIIYQGQNILQKANIKNSRREAILLINHALKIKEYEILSNPNKTINKKDYEIIIDLLKKRAQGQPHAYLINNKNFYNLKFYINKNVLIPRPETEHIVEYILKNIKKNAPINIIDLGVGCGTVLLSLLYNLPFSYGVGIDVSIKALEVAKKNINNFNLNDRCELVKGDWANSITSNYFDILICNPPYIDEKHINNLNKNVKNFEPLIALNGGKNGLEVLNNLLPSARKCLKKNGLAFFEIGYDQSIKAQKLIYKNKFKIYEIIKDFARYERVIVVKPIL
tara:strand:+ start:7435 stop:8283 length:849 start_codon:yes stop_codon:yes gene_type:complete